MKELNFLILDLLAFKFMYFIFTSIVVSQVPTILSLKIDKKKKPLTTLQFVFSISCTTFRKKIKLSGYLLQLKLSLEFPRGPWKITKICSFI